RRESPSRVVCHASSSRGVGTASGHVRTAQEYPVPSSPNVPERRGPSPILRRVRLVVAVVNNEDAGALVDALLEKEYRATRLHSSGGFLKQSNATIILGVEEAAVDEVIEIIAANCKSRTQVVSPMPPI